MSEFADSTLPHTMSPRSTYLPTSERFIIVVIVVLVIALLAVLLVR